MEIFTANYIKGYFNRTKYYYFISIGILTVSALIGMLFSSYFDSYMFEYVLSSTGILEEIQVSFFDIFPHNLMIDWSVIVCGLFFSIISLGITFINGMIIGYFFANSDLLTFAFGIAPHGLFEIPSSIVALVGSFLVTVLEIKLMHAFLSKNNTVKNELYGNGHMIKDIIASFGYVFILLLIAGIIESAITPLLLFGIAL